MLREAHVRFPRVLCVGGTGPLEPVQYHSQQGPVRLIFLNPAAPHQAVCFHPQLWQGERGCRERQGVLRAKQGGRGSREVVTGSTLKDVMAEVPGKGKSVKPNVECAKI